MRDYIIEKGLSGRKCTTVLLGVVYMGPHKSETEKMKGKGKTHGGKICVTSQGHLRQQSGK